MLSLLNNCIPVHIELNFNNSNNAFHLYSLLLYTDMLYLNKILDRITVNLCPNAFINIIYMFDSVSAVFNNINLFQVCSTCIFPLFQRDPPDEDVPYCTLKSFPAQIEHCIQWARDKVNP